MARIAAIAKQHGIPLLVLVIPTSQSIEVRQGHPSIKGLDYELPTKFARARLAELGIPFVDISDTLAAQKHLETVYFSYDGHLTPFGHRLAAEALGPRINELTGSATAAAAPPAPAAAGSDVGP